MYGILDECRGEFMAVGVLVPKGWAVRRGKKLDRSGKEGTQ